MEYIEREAAIKIASGYCHPANVAAELAKLPAADVRPVVSGKWEEETGFIFSDLSQQVRCSKCGLIAYFYDKMPMNFCPNCGAMMEES